MSAGTRDELAELTAQQAKAVHLLCMGASYRDVGRAVGCSERTISDWMTIGHPVHTQVSQAHQHLRDATLGRMAPEIHAILAELQRIAISGERESDRIKAGTHLLGLYGITPVSRVSHQHESSQPIDPTDISAVKQRALAILDYIAQMESE